MIIHQIALMSSRIDFNFTTFAFKFVRLESFDDLLDRGLAHPPAAFRARFQVFEPLD
jgi:hypothetical protein